MSRIEKLQEFIQQAGEDSFLEHALALEYLKVGKLEEAKQLFEQLLNREPGYVGSYYHLGKLHEQLGENESAMMVYEKGILAATKVGDQHARNELQMAKDELE
jgi:Tfp pilus assembly protein PilF